MTVKIIEPPVRKGDGFCACGCGERTRLSDRTDAKRGVVRGEPLLYVNGHSRRNQRLRRYEICDCGYETPCWVWLLHLNPRTGYGYEHETGRSLLAHRYIYEQRRGPIPDGAQLDHLCRNRACVNPDHLEPVTNAENTRRGDRTRLTRDDVEAIRESDADTITLGSRYGVHPSHVSRIRKGHRWVAA